VPAASLTDPARPLESAETVTLTSSSTSSARRVVAAGSGAFPTAPGVPEDRRPERSLCCDEVCLAQRHEPKHRTNAVGWPFCPRCRAKAPAFRGWPWAVPRGSLRVSRGRSAPPAHSALPRRLLGAFPCAFASRLPVTRPANPDPENMSASAALPRSPVCASVKRAHPVSPACARRVLPADRVVWRMASAAMAPCRHPRTTLPGLRKE